MTFAAGLSMGGYGALKLALAFPERFRAAASLSGAVDVVSLAERIRKEAKGGPDAFGPVYGNRQIRGSRDDLLSWQSLRHKKAESSQNSINGAGNRISCIRTTSGSEIFLRKRALI